MVVTATFTSEQTVAVTGYTTSPRKQERPQHARKPDGDDQLHGKRCDEKASFTVSVSVKIVTWASGTDQEIADMVATHDAGLLNLQDYWAVGQERDVNLTKMSAAGVGGEPRSADGYFGVIQRRRKNFGKW